MANASAHWTTIETPIGSLLLLKTDAGLCRIAFEDESFAHVIDEESERRGIAFTEHPAAFAEELRQFDEYFAGTRTSFSLPFEAPSTGFRQRAQLALATIGYGETRSYGEIAEQIGHPRAARAVGTACATNPLPLILPCHRVLAAGGALGGYNGGLWRKELLLELEGVKR